MSLDAMRFPPTAVNDEFLLSLYSAKHQIHASHICLHFRGKVIAYELMLPRKKPSEGWEVLTPIHISKGQG